MKIYFISFFETNLIVLMVKLISDYHKINYNSNKLNQYEDLIQRIVIEFEVFDIGKAKIYIDK